MFWNVQETTYKGWVNFIFNGKKRWVTNTALSLWNKAWGLRTGITVLAHFWSTVNPLLQMQERIKRLIPLMFYGPVLQPLFIFFIFSSRKFYKEKCSYLAVFLYITKARNYKIFQRKVQRLTKMCWFCCNSSFKTKRENIHKRAGKKVIMSGNFLPFCCFYNFAVGEIESLHPLLLVSHAKFKCWTA